MDQETKQAFENLTSLVQEGFSKHDVLLKKHDEDIENLALMTQHSFNEIEEKNQVEHNKLNQRFDELIKNTDAFYHLHQKLDVELTITQHNCQELDKRVTVLETAKA